MLRKNKQLNAEECVALLDVRFLKDDPSPPLIPGEFFSTPSKKSKKRSRSKGSYISLIDSSDSYNSDSDGISEENWDASVAYDSEPFESASVELDAARVKKLKVILLVIL